MCKNTKKSQNLLGFSNILYIFVRKKGLRVLFSGTPLETDIINNKITANYG